MLLGKKARSSAHGAGAGVSTHACRRYFLEADDSEACTSLEGFKARAMRSQDRVGVKLVSDAAMLMVWCETRGSDEMTMSSSPEATGPSSRQEPR